MLPAAPMDLSTISQKIMRGLGYASMHALKQDVDLITANCR